MEASREQRMFLVLVLLFLGRTEQATESSPQQDLECIVFDYEYMDCDWGSKQKPAGNYSLYYWYESDKEKQCEIYLQSGDINTGCRFREIKPFKYFHIYVNTSDGTKVFQKEMQLQNQVKPSPPIDFRFEEKSNNQLLLSWGSASPKNHCLEHYITYKSSKDKKWQEVKTNDMKYSVASVDPKKLYTFYVKSKVRSVCATTNFWSDPAGPLFWGRNTTSEDDPPVSIWIQRIIIPVGSVLLLLLLLLILMRMERVWLVLMPRIPNPRNKFEDLFTAHQGNFSEWAGVSKDAVESFKPNYRESICCVSELFPGGGYLPICNNAMGKAGGVAGIPADPTLKVNIE
ncbi:cytokine receptor common subunit gamma [Podarcis raffonei]|uniref:cytokine receptor common subunit gamma n=1 Tax=Podarcis raffonei TaxID=65483 RepID=UPI0023297587|nr:cytokine receptor common subunit gamma [Podarcis raffonei]